MANFQFLKPGWAEIFDSAAKAESLVYSDPRACCFYARRTLELAVQWLYSNDTFLQRPYDDSLSTLIHEPTFKDNLAPGIFPKVRVIKDLGNLAVHSNRPVSQTDSLQATKELFHFLYWMARNYTRGSAADFDGVNFDAALIPRAGAQSILGQQQTIQQLQALEVALHERDEKLAVQARQIEDTDAEIARLKQEIAEAKARNQQIPDDHDYSEAETRDFFIDLLLREAGWSLDKPEDREYPVTGMPNVQGKGFVDYVLWDDNGLPLAVVEAKRTKKDARIGQQQAKLYADCLEKQYGQRPVIFYTNGYQHWIWDDVMYPPRAVQGFYKKDELQLVIQRRTTRKALGAQQIEKQIVERYYQEEAIRNVGEAFENKQRKALIVMATGAGKTRTVIALCELLQRCNWIKRVLFLADRVALVKQAVNAFKTHLPNSSPVNLVTEKEDTGSRVYVSTYPTMVGLIDRIEGGDARRFGVGYFDLVVIDEAHRSVYQKYGAIFEYFDSLLVGLTATPKAEVDKNTYRLFDLEKGVPTYAYDLEQAVSDGYLVPPRPIAVPMKFQRHGITYDDLPDEEKEEWDLIEWEEEGERPDRIEAAALNKWLFNADTVDKVLETLLLRGIRVAGGDRLGKTIIFAKNHKHAVYIQERFDKNYPHLKGAFARVIDHYEAYAQSILDDFSIAEKVPHIAISVDMLDTGIDVPEVVNLVFFKLVRSKTKFFQMIGRGTRLRKNLFGPGDDKEFFYLFDYCENLEFFSQNAAGVEGNTQEPLGKKIFLERLELVETVRTLVEPPDDMISLADETVETLRTEVTAMNTDNFIVRPHRKEVEKFREPAAWEEINETDHYELSHIVAGLPTELDPEDETAKRFDLLILRLQLSILQVDHSFTRLRDQVKEIASRLEEKESIPMVRAQIALIADLQTEEYWQDVTVPMLEQVRKKLRDLVKFIDKKGRKIIYTDFEDEVGEIQEFELSGLPTATDLVQYRKKVTAFIRSHENHITINKLKHNLPITETDIAELERLLFEAGGPGRSFEDFQRAFPKENNLGAFVRHLVGLDREAAKQAFGEYLNGRTLTASQIRFIDMVVDYLTQNGVMDPGLLYTPPYTDLNPSGLDGVFEDSDAERIVGILKDIERNAAA
jgi:type I restriction enzyme R subunit